MNAVGDRSMTKEEQDKYIAEHYEEETQADLCRATGVPTGSIGYRIYRLKRDGLIAKDAQPKYKAYNDVAKEEPSGQETALPAPAACQTGMHTNWWTGPDAVIERRYPHFFLDGARAPSEHPMEWQVCVDCGYAEQIRPKYPWDKGVSVALVPNRDGLHWPSPARPIEAASPEAETVDVIEEPGSEAMGEVLLEAESDPGDEQPQLAATTSANPIEAQEAHRDEIVRLQTELGQAKSDVMLLRVKLLAQKEEMQGLEVALAEAQEQNTALYAKLREVRDQLRLVELHGQLRDLERQASAVRDEIEQIKGQAA